GQAGSIATLNWKEDRNRHECRNHARRIKTFSSRVIGPEVQTALHEKSVSWPFPVPPLCSLCLCGCFFEQFLTTETQRTQRLHREEVPGFKTAATALYQQRLSSVRVVSSRSCGR